MSSPVRFYAIEGPVWLPANAPARTLYQPAGQRRAKVLFLGASVSQTGDPRLMEAAGSLSRSIPLLLSESAFVLLGLDTAVLLPWSVDRGFVILPQPWSAEDTASAAQKAGAGLCVVMHVVANPAAVRIEVRLLRSHGNEKWEIITEWTGEVSGEQPGEALHGLWARLANTLVAELGDAPAAPDAERYKVPNRAALPAYLLALDGASGLRCQGSEALGPGVLPGQHAAVRQILYLAQAHPGSLPMRLLLHEALLRMRTLDASYSEGLADAVKALQENAAFRDATVSAILEQQLRLLDGD